jgi:hypothetical protein
VRESTPRLASTGQSPTVVDVGQSFGDLDFGNQRTGIDATGDATATGVSINEIILGVSIAGPAGRGRLRVFDRRQRRVTIDELRAVGYALNGIPTPLPTPPAPFRRRSPCGRRTAAAKRHRDGHRHPPSASPTSPFALAQPDATATSRRASPTATAPPATPTAITPKHRHRHQLQRLHRLPAGAR